MRTNDVISDVSSYDLILGAVIGILQRRQQPHNAEAGFRDVAFANDLRSEKEVALEQIEPERKAALKVVVGLHFLGDQACAETAQAGNLLVQLAIGAIGYFDLDDVGEFEQRVDLGGVFAQHEIVEHDRSEEHTSELQSLMRISYAVFCLKKKITT